MSKPDLPDLDALQFDELWTIHEELTKILSDRILGEKRELEKRLAILNQTDSFGNEAGGNDLRNRPLRRKYPKVLPKYFNPSLPNETWSGRGKKPRWLIVALQKGHVLEELKIKRGDRDSVDELIADEKPSSR
jgi:DNA-binding protein H-NS